MKSKINLELKYHCQAFSPFRMILEGLGARKVVTKHQKDYFFNLSVARDLKTLPRLKLRVENQHRELIYYQRPPFVERRGASATITLYPVRDSALFDFLRKALGVLAVVEKTRELWRKGNATFHLDHVKGVGNIFEIEISTTPRNNSPDRKKLADYRRKFLPYLSRMVKGSNLDLVLRRSAVRKS